MSSPAANTAGGSRRLFVHTFGCQMNEVDSRRMVEMMCRHGWSTTDEPSAADLILLNTCAIRDKAEQKVLSALGRYRQLKLAHGARIAVSGCVAQGQKEKLLRRAPYLDLVLGPDAIAKLPELVARVESERKCVVETAWIESQDYVFPRADQEAARGSTTAFVVVMKGCDNACSYCVVPRTRGREVSRPVDQILAEVHDLVAVGVREVTLIGQNVNSYDGGCDFSELLRRVCAAAGVWRIRFTTSHPKDLSEDLVAAVGELPKVCPHFHLPVQSGSDAVLARMRRGYTAAQYLAKLAALRRARPGIAVSTDVIVGFPGESEEDFQQTMELIENARYDNVYSFVYSPRPHTAAKIRESEWGPVPREVKVERLERLQARSRAIVQEQVAAWVGRTTEVLVEGLSRFDPARRSGRTPENRVVNFDGDAAAGSLTRARLTAATPNAFSGTQETGEEGATCSSR